MLLLTPAFAAAARAGDDPPAADPAPRMTVTGRVLDPQGQPVPNATVMAYAALRNPRAGGAYGDMSPAPIGQGRCDAAGRFRVDAVRTTSAGHHDVGVVALAPGFGAGWAELDPDAEDPAADITLRPEQVIDGRLFDVNGRPVRDAEVTVQTMGSVTPPRLGTLIPESTDGPAFSPFQPNDLPAWPRPAFSDADGRFTVRGVPRGFRIVLAVHDPRFARVRASIDTHDAARSKPVTLALEPARVLAGRVTDAETNRPVARARLVVLSWKEGRGTFNLFDADDQGRFRMNPLSADGYDVTVHAPVGQPYLRATTPRFDWPKGAVERRIDYALQRGVPVRGKVVEEGTGRPVAGARVSYRPTRPGGRAGADGYNDTATADDGSFVIAVPPGPGYLVVLGPTDEDVYQSIDSGVVDAGQPGGRRFYAHGLVRVEAKPGVEISGVAIALRRGGTVRGRIVGPDGRPIPSAELISGILHAPTVGTWRYWNFRYIPRTRDGRFAIHGLDPNAGVPVHVFAAGEELGATAVLSGRSGSGGPITIRLGPCGAARARLVDRDRKPVAGFRGSRLIAMIVTPGSARGEANPQGLPEASMASLAALDPAHYGVETGPVSDADGRIALPALIPGATYRVQVVRRGAPPTFRKDIVVKPGETVDLGEIVVERPS